LSRGRAARLREQTNLVEEVTWQPPWMEQPEQLGELLGWLWFNQPPADFSALTNRLAPDHHPGSWGQPARRPDLPRFGRC